MTIGFPSIRVDGSNCRHHLWDNNGTWWVHYTLHFDGRKRRIRRSLGTVAVGEAIRRRDELFDRLLREGEPVPERRPCTRSADDGPPTMPLREWLFPSACVPATRPPCSQT